MSYWGNDMTVHMVVEVEVHQSNHPRVPAQKSELLKGVLSIGSSRDDESLPLLLIPTFKNGTTLKETTKDSNRHQVKRHLRHEPCSLLHRNADWYLVWVWGLKLQQTVVREGPASRAAWRGARVAGRGV